MVNSLWEIKTNETWPPNGYPQPPISYTSSKLLKECRLRAAFASSSRKVYPRKLNQSARLGLSFHKTMEELKIVVNSYEGDSSAFAQFALDLFQQYLSDQKKISSQQPREKLDSWSITKINRMENVVIVSARDMFSKRREHSRNTSLNKYERRPNLLVEHKIISEDGLIEGVVDCIDYLDGHYRIIDYKTTSKPTEEDLNEHSQQIKLYAYLWFDESKHWAFVGSVFYPIADQKHSFELDQKECLNIAKEIKNDALQLLKERPSIEALGNPGEVCSYCEFRPWCKPFWQMQNSLPEDIDIFKNFYKGFEGVIQNLSSKSEVTLIEIATLHRTIELRIKLSDFPHLKPLKVNDQVRVLDAKLVGTSSRPSSEVNDKSEIYKLIN